MASKVLDFDDEFENAESKGNEKVVELSAKQKPVPKLQNWKDSLAFKILDDIFFSGSMPLLMKYFHNYNFYPLEIDPDTLTLFEHFQIYMQHIPFLLIYYASIVLRGVGQVFICNHPVTGLFVCAGLYLTSPTLMIYALLGAIYENIGAFIVCKPIVAEVEAGLFGYDGTLVGCAVYSFLSMSSTEYVEPSLSNRGMLILFVLSFTVGVIHSTCVNLNNMPALTLAFNILTMAFILSLARHNSTVATLAWQLPSTAGASEETDWGDMSPLFVLDAALRGIGQFCFVGTTLGGGLVLAGITICSRRAGYMALIGSLTSMLMCYYVIMVPKTAHPVVRNGIYGYNAMGTCVAVGGDIFYHSDVPNTIVAILGAALTVLMQVAIQSILDTDQLGLPVLTCPFVLTAWMVMMSRSDWLQPITNAGEDLDDAQRMDRRHEDSWYYRPPKKLTNNESPERQQLRQLIKQNTLTKGDLLGAGAGIAGAGFASPGSTKLTSGKFSSAKYATPKIAEHSEQLEDV